MKYKIITNDDQYNEYCETHEKLSYKDHLKYQDEIDLIELLIDDYENRILDPVYEPSTNAKLYYRRGRYIQNRVSKTIEATYIRYIIIS